jgi:hypothetical protein
MPSQIPDNRQALAAEARPVPKAGSVVSGLPAHRRDKRYLLAPAVA